MPPRFVGNTFIFVRRTNTFMGDYRSPRTTSPTTSVNIVLPTPATATGQKSHVFGYCLTLSSLCLENFAKYSFICVYTKNYQHKHQKTLGEQSERGENLHVASFRCSAHPIKNLFCFAALIKTQSTNKVINYGSQHIIMPYDRSKYANTTKTILGITVIMQNQKKKRQKFSIFSTISKKIF